MGTYLGAGKRSSERLREKLRQAGLYVDYSDMDRGWEVPGEIPEQWAVNELRDARDGLVRVQHYRDRGLYELEMLQRRRQACHAVYEKWRTIPRKGVDWSEFVVDLHDKRLAFFDLLVAEGILERMSP